MATRRILGVLAVAGLFMVMLISTAPATDMPHSGQYANCSGCHMLHNSQGPSLTNSASNSNLCISCHQGGATATNFPFSADMQPGGLYQTSHSWGGTCTPGTVGQGTGDLPSSANDQGMNNPYGLRSVDDIINDGTVSSSLKTVLESYGCCSNPTYTTWSKCETNGGYWTAQVVCSSCHNQHSQYLAAWDASAAATQGQATGGSTTTVQDTTQSWSTNEWVSAKGTNYVLMTSGPNQYVEEPILSNDNQTLTVSTAFANNVQAGNTYVILAEGRHFMRIANDLSQLCETCHYYRTAAASETSVASIETYDGNVKSHPVNEDISTDPADPSYFVGTAPYEPNCRDIPANCAQTNSPRYDGNGGTDTDATNNIVFDANGKIRCLSCHGIHYTDSNTSTVDQP